MNKDNQIIEFLNEGKSYTYIQDVLKVSPSKIAMIKKRLLSVSSVDSSKSSSKSSSASSRAMNSTTTDNNGCYFEDIDEITAKNEDFENINEKKTIMESQNNELEKFKLELNYNLELKKLELQQESFDLQSRDLQIKKTMIDIEKQKIEREGKNLILKFRKLMLKYKNGTKSYLKLDEYVEDLIALREEIREYCFREDFDTDDLTILSNLNQTICTFQDYIKQLVYSYQEECIDCENYGDCDDCKYEIEESEASEMEIQITVDSETQQMIEESQTIDFYYYD